MNFNPAALELSGCLTAYSYWFFETVTEERALRVMDEEATLPDSQFNQICSELSDILSGKKMIVEQSVSDENEELSSPELDELRDSFQTFQMHSPRRFYTAEHRRFTFGTESKSQAENTKSAP
ncbi:unnamed protein product [Gongylonema pulchrum]|uniref:Rab3 GTPase-activating protein catalytic subunit n=1 Tax=Gongylonema pulchrum TaxID=637853 RepID=A0A183D8P2_9BILA|nr:unnamed protein product [Gongylonema pulchrum]